MSIHRSTESNSRDVTVVFSLADDTHPGPVSVVGSFNHWTPGEHPLLDEGDGRRSASVVVPSGSEVHFRYLGADGNWFDDPDADELTNAGGVIYLAEPESAVDSTSAEPASPEPVTAETVTAETDAAEPDNAETASAETSALDRAAALGPLPGVERIDAIENTTGDGSATHDSDAAAHDAARGDLPGAIILGH